VNKCRLLVLLTSSTRRFILTYFPREADTIPTDSVPTDAIPTVRSQDDPVYL